MRNFPCDQGKRRMLKHWSVQLTFMAQDYQSLGSVYRKLKKLRLFGLALAFQAENPRRLQFFTSIGGSTYDQWHGSGWDLDRNLRKPGKPQILNASKIHKIKRPLWTEESRTSGHSRILCGVPILKFCSRRVPKQRGISPHASKSSSSLSMADRLSKIWAGKHYEITKRVQLAPQNDPCFENLQSKLRISATKWKLLPSCIPSTKPCVQPHSMTEHWSPDTSQVQQLSTMANGVPPSWSSVGSSVFGWV